MKDDTQERDRGDLVEAGIDLSDAESSTKADTIITVKQTNEEAVHGKGKIYLSEFETTAAGQIMGKEQRCQVIKWASVWR